MKIYNFTSLLGPLILVFGLISCSKGQESEGIVKQDQKNKIMKSDSEWKDELTAEEYHVLRQKGTEPAFTGKYWDNHDQGIYYCAACHQKIFDAKAKFNSGTG